MVAVRKITGRVEIRVNGELYLTKQNAKATGIGGNKKIPVMGEVYHGTVEEPTPNTCEFTITDHDQKLLIPIAQLEDATVTFERAGGGKVYTLVGAACEGGFELTAGEGEVPIVFFGEVWEEEVAA